MKKQCDVNTFATKIKICGLYREEDIGYANEVHPDYVGFIINFPNSHRSITGEQVAYYREKLENTIQSVGVFVDTNIEEIVKLGKYLDVIQLHGEEDAHYIEQLRCALSGQEIWKAYKIRGICDIEAAADSSADCVILDNGYGTGAQFEWSLFKEMEHLKRPFILAGGITKENIQEAIQTFHPYALDMSSGVETNRCKDLEKMKHVVAHVRRITRE